MSISGLVTCDRGQCLPTLLQRADATLSAAPLSQPRYTYVYSSLLLYKPQCGMQQSRTTLSAPMHSAYTALQSVPCRLCHQAAVGNQQTLAPPYLASMPRPKERYLCLLDDLVDGLADLGVVGAYYKLHRDAARGVDPERQPHQRLSQHMCFSSRHSSRPLLCQAHALQHSLPLLCEAHMSQVPQASQVHRTAKRGIQWKKQGVPTCSGMAKSHE